MRYREMPSISITLDRAAGRSLHEQLAHQIAAAIDAGSLAHNTRMPSTRTLALVVDVSRGVSAAAYDLLTARGYLHARTGSGTYVLGRTRPKPVVPEAQQVIDMRPGLPSTEALPVNVWRAAWRHASYQRPPVSGPPALGLPALREAIASHLQLTRGFTAGSHQIVVTSGLAAGLRLVVAALGLDGREVAMEHPAPPSLWRAIRPVPMVLGEEVPDDCRIAVVSPDSHAATGRVMPAARRRQLAAWAARSNGIIVETAGVNVVRPDTIRLPKLLDLAGRNTCVAGSFSDLLTPAVQLGYVVVPSALAEQVGELIVDRPSHIVQLAAAQLIADGAAVRLMHRVERLRARKRAIVESMLSALPREFTLDGMEAVNLATVRLPEGVRAADLADALAARGVRTETFAPYHFSQQQVPQALLLGYGHQPDPLLQRALTTLVSSAAAMSQ
ncbi:MAG: PLP-dependent aminotransferase family protein [Kibdelosporangium sp.]